MERPQSFDKTIRIFISSTFKDMNDERNYLTDKIFPRLQHEAKSKGINLKFIDLRWGITEEEAKQGRVIETCLREIDECRPFFIGLLGERYGWIPQYKDFGTLQEQLFGRYDWLRKDVDEGLSITEIEMQYAALRNEDVEHAHFFIRSSRHPASTEHREESGTAAREKLKKLKSRILSQNKYPVDSYGTVEELGELVYEALKKLTDKFERENLDPEENEYNLHELNIATRTENYIENKKFLTGAHEWLNSSGRVLLVGGNAYMGKSTHLCRFLTECREQNTGYKVVYHDVEIRDKSTYDTRKASEIMTDHITSGLGRLYGWKDKESGYVTGFLTGLFKMMFLSYFRAMALTFKSAFSRKSEDSLLSDYVEKTRTDYTEAIQIYSKGLKRYLKRIARKKDSILVFIDNIDELSDDEEKGIADFIGVFPPNVRFVISARSGSVAETVLRRELNASVLTINGFDNGMAQAFAQKYLSAYSKRLSGSQLDVLLDGFYIHNPYLFSNVLERLVSFGSFENLSKEISAFSTLTDEKSLCRKIVDGLFGEFKGIFVTNPLSDAFYALAISNRGLTEEEIEKALVFKPIEWSSVRGHVLSLCMNVDDKYKIRNGNIKEAVINATDKAGQESVRQKMIAYFEGLMDFEHRSGLQNLIGGLMKGKIAEESFLNQRQAEELPSLYLQESAFDKLYRYVIFVYNDCHFTKDERLRYWKALYDNGYTMALSARERSRNGKLVPMKIHSDELVPTRNDFRDYYGRLLETAYLLRQSEDGKWAREQLYKYQDDDKKNSPYKKDHDTLVRMNDLIMKGRFADAIECGMSHRFTDTSTRIRADILMAVSYKNTGDYSTAVRLCRKAMENARQHPEKDMGLIAETTVHYCNLCAESGDEYSARKTLDILSGVHDYQMGIGLQHPTTYLMLVAYGKLYAILKDFSLSLNCYNDAYRSSLTLYGEESYNSHIALGMVGIAQAMTGQIQDADITLKTAIEKIKGINPQDPALYNMLVYRYFINSKTGKCHEALEIIMNARRIYDTFPNKNPEELDWLEKSIHNARATLKK